MIKKSNTNIVFYYESNILGGVESLFSSIINEYKVINNKEGSYNFYVYSDTVDSIYLKLVLDKNIVSNLDFMDDHDILVTPLSSIYNLYRKAPKLKSRILLWSLHPFNCISITPGLSKLNKFGVDVLKLVNKSVFVSYLLNKNIFQKLIKLNSLYFMDGDSIASLKFFYNIKVKEDRIIPLFPPNKPPIENYYPYYYKTKECVIKRAIWIGRDDLFKTLPLLEYLSSGALKEWELTLIGFKDNYINATRFKGLVRKTIFINSLGFAEIDQHIKANNYKLALGMGLSSITLASYGIPTILINPSYSANSNKPIKLYKSENYSLGSFDFHSKYLKTISNDLTDFKNVEIHKQKKFIESFNSIKTITLLIKAAEKSECKISDLRILLKANVLQYIYGKITKN